MAYSTPEFLMYGLLLVFGTVLMHAVSKHRLGTRSGVAYYRRFLSERDRRKMSDAQLRGRLQSFHAKPVAWLLDALAMAGMIVAVIVGQQLSGHEAGLSGSLKYLIALLLIGLPVMFAVNALRAALYRRNLQAILQPK